MNDHRRVDLHSSIKASSSSVPIGRKVATWLLAAFIILVMIVWFGFLGWGVVATLQWLLDFIRNFSADF
jgi:type VI protein secretion system component VasF